MNRLLFHLTVSLLLISCGNSSLDKTTLTKTSDSSVISKSDTIPITKETVSVSTKPDSIDKVNSNTISTDGKNYIGKATISKSDSTIWLTADMKLDYRIFGYDKPDITSRKMILLSIFTSDVKGNPFKCPFGSYYQSIDMTDMELKYISTVGNFIKVNILKNGAIQGIVYIDKKWIEFEE